jgi:uncharacterized protein YbjT (DUF2867 family)
MKTILVIGSTGLQGTAVVNALLASSFTVRALVRDHSSKKARALQAKGVEIVEGDLDDITSIRHAMQDIYGVYSMQNWQTWEGSDARQMEIQAGIRVADVAWECGVSHLVYSSAGGADRAPGIKTWEGKYQVEKHIKTLGIQYSILRPVAFMDNFFQPALPQMLALYKIALAGKSIQLIASEDIGKWAALMFNEPQKYAGVTLEIAGDELTYTEIQNTFLKVLGQPINELALPETILDTMGDAALPLQWLHDTQYCADIPKLRKSLPAMMTFREWLTKHRGRFYQFATEAKDSHKTLG